MKILVTGAAGFIGYHFCKALLQQEMEVVGLDNINDYYDVNLKFDRLDQLGIRRESADILDTPTESTLFGDQFTFVRSNLENRSTLPEIFKKFDIDIVCNLAAQAGIRYSLENPEAYVDSNLVGFLNVLECCRNFDIEHLIYASSSSVYGLNEKIPFSTSDCVDRPISLYAATKKSNELMAHTYSHLFNIPTTGLRFFTVYGPWGRPDMAMFLFTDAIAEGRPIKVFNEGKMERDFTYIDDIIQGLLAVVLENLALRRESKNLYKIYNIGNNKSVKLLDFIHEIEENLNKKAIKEMLPIQPGDVARTWANVDAMKADYNYVSNTSIKEGVKNFISWYLNYYTGNQHKFQNTTEEE